MRSLILEWQENSQIRSQTIFDLPATKKAVIGRDKEHCDIVLNDNTHTVSRIHGEIIFERSQGEFYLLNRTRERVKPNPIYVNGQKIIHELAPLKIGSEICFGKVKLTVKAIEHERKSEPNTGLKCHVCGKISPHSDLSFVCRWCGASLASAISVYNE